jgi:hypothetical protein
VKRHDVVVMPEAEANIIAAFDDIQESTYRTWSVEKERRDFARYTQ